MKAYTNYPLYPTEHGRSAKTRLVTIINYDGNKYCRIQFDDVEYEVKKGYLWRTRRKVSYKHSTLERHFNKVPWIYD